MNRRNFVKGTVLTGAAVALAPLVVAKAITPKGSLRRKWPKYHLVDEVDDTDKRTIHCLTTVDIPSEWRGQKSPYTIFRRSEVIGYKNKLDRDPEEVKKDIVKWIGEDIQRYIKNRK